VQWEEIAFLLITTGSTKVSPSPDDIWTNRLLLLQALCESLSRVGRHVILNGTGILHPLTDIGNLPKRHKLLQLFLQVFRERNLPELWI
jgi:hypothetical protein